MTINHITYYPEFGVTPRLKQELSLTNRISSQTLAIFNSMHVTSLAGAICFGVLGGALFLTAMIIYEIFREMLYQCNKERYRLEFEPGNTQTGAPKLGRYDSIDLRVSNHATESLEWKKELIQSAEHSIELSANFAGGEAFREVLKLIKKRMDLYPDLKVHILLSEDLLEAEDIALLEAIKKDYSSFEYLITKRIYTLEPELLSEENHVKMLLVDGKYFVMGGTGIHEKMGREEVLADFKTSGTLASRFIDKAFRDTDIIGYGKIAKTMRGQFYNLYRIWEHRMTGSAENRFFSLDENTTSRCHLFHKTEGLIRNARTKFIVGGPEHRAHNPISAKIARLITKSKREVRMANLLFNPDPMIKNALRERKERGGVSIVGYFNGTNENSAHQIYALPNRVNYDLVDCAYEYNEEYQLYHKKLTTIDEEIVVIGSYNLGVKSSKCDYECVCVIDDARVAALMNKALDIDSCHSNMMTQSHIGWWDRLIGRIAIAALGSLFG